MAPRSTPNRPAYAAEVQPQKPDFKKELAELSAIVAKSKVNPETVTFVKHLDAKTKANDINADYLGKIITSSYRVFVDKLSDVEANTFSAHTSSRLKRLFLKEKLTDADVIKTLTILNGNIILTLGDDRQISLRLIPQEALTPAPQDDRDTKQAEEQTKTAAEKEEEEEKATTTPDNTEKLTEVGKKINFALSQYERADNKKITDDGAVVLGSVDATEFKRAKETKRKKHYKKWCADVIDAANELIQLRSAGRLGVELTQHVDRLEDALKSIAQISTAGDIQANFNAFEENPKNNFGRCAFSDSELLAADGAYNVLTAYLRASRNLSLELQKNEKLKFEVRIGNKRYSQKDRYAVAANEDYAPSDEAQETPEKGIKNKQRADYSIDPDMGEEPEEAPRGEEKKEDAPSKQPEQKIQKQTFEANPEDVPAPRRRTPEADKLPVPNESATSSRTEQATISSAAAAGAPLGAEGKNNKAKGTARDEEIPFPSDEVVDTVTTTATGETVSGNNETKEANETKERFTNVQFTPEERLLLGQFIATNHFEFDAKKDAIKVGKVVVHKNGLDLPILKYKDNAADGKLWFACYSEGTEGQFGTVDGTVHSANTESLSVLLPEVVRKFEYEQKRFTDRKKAFEEAFTAPTYSVEFKNNILEVSRDGVLAAIPMYREGTSPSYTTKFEENTNETYSKKFGEIISDLPNRTGEESPEELAKIRKTVTDDEILRIKNMFDSILKKPAIQGAQEAAPAIAPAAPANATPAASQEKTKLEREAEVHKNLDARYYALRASLAPFLKENGFGEIGEPNALPKNPNITTDKDVVLSGKIVKGDVYLRFGVEDDKYDVAAFKDTGLLDAIHSDTMTGSNGVLEKTKAMLKKLGLLGPIATAPEAVPAAPASTPVETAAQARADEENSAEKGEAEVKKTEAEKMKETDNQIHQQLDNKFKEAQTALMPIFEKYGFTGTLSSYAISNEGEPSLRSTRLTREDQSIKFSVKKDSFNVYLFEKDPQSPEEKMLSNGLGVSAEEIIKMTENILRENAAKREAEAKKREPELIKKTFAEIKALPQLKKYDVELSPDETTAFIETQKKYGPVKRFAVVLLPTIGADGKKIYSGIETDMKKHETYKDAVRFKKGDFETGETHAEVITKLLKREPAEATGGSLDDSPDKAEMEYPE